MTKHWHLAPFSASHWWRGVRRSVSLAALIVLLWLGVGVLGYHWIGDLPWVDALLESSMLLGGMGAIAPMHSDAVKLFASFYALVSGLVLISTTSLLLAPWLHRLFYHTHRQAHRDARTDEGVVNE